MRAMFAVFLLFILSSVGFAQSRDPSDRARNVERSRDAAETRIDRIYEQNLQAAPSTATPAVSATVPARTFGVTVDHKKKKLDGGAPKSAAPESAPMRVAPR